MKGIFALLFVFFMVAMVFTPAFVQASVVVDSWITRAPMGQARSGLGVVAVDGKIYAIGGYTGRTLTGANEMYDPDRDVWVNKTAMPTPREYFAIVVYQNKIYCIGGRTGTEVFDERTGSTIPVTSNKTEVYDTVTDTWTTKASMPSTSMHITAQEVNGKIYVISRNIYAYNPSTDSWTTTTSLPYSIYAGSSPVSVVVDNKIIVTGEYSSAMRFYIYSPEFNNLTVGENAPLIVGNGAGGVTSGVEAPERVYLFGLASEMYPPYSINQVYDPKTANWTLATAMPTSRVEFGVAVVSDTLYAVGGIVITYSYDATGKYIQGRSDSLTNINEQYIPIGYKTIQPSPTVSSSVSSASGNQQPATLDFSVLIVVMVVIVLVATAMFLFWRRTRRSNVSGA